MIVIAMSLRNSITLLGLIVALVIAPARAELRIIETQHYRVHTDLDPRLADDLAARMEAMFGEYSQRFSDFPSRSTKRFEVDLFAHRADYTALTGARFSNTGGLFMPQKSLLAAFLESQGRDGLRRTLQHEAFHQFAATSIGPRMPVWLNEGIAQVFEEGLWCGETFEIGQVPPRRMRQLALHTSQHRFLPFKDFVALSEAEWTAGLADASTAAARYDQAWVMAHFLIFAPDENGQPKYRARLIEMLRLLNAGFDSQEAFVRAFSDNFAGFEQRFVEYLHTMQPTEHAIMIENQSVLADMLVLLARQQRSFDDADALRQFIATNGVRLKYHHGDVDWSSDDQPANYFCDLDARPFTSSQLFFSFRGGAPLPDLICKPSGGLTYRTVFHQELSRIDHETIITRR